MNSYIEFPALGIKLFVDRVAFSIGDKPIYWYGIIIATGLILGMICAILVGKKTDVSSETITDVVLYGIPVGIICARLYYVAFEFSDYKDNFLDIFKIWNGGIAIYGAVIGCLISTYIYCKCKKLSFLKVADTCCVGLLVGQIVGRWGNFVNQEAFGGNTTLPWGMTGSRIKEELAIMAENGMGVVKTLPVHPTFLYESLWNVGVLAVILFVIFKAYKYRGKAFFSYIGLYGLGRLWIEGLRTDSLYFGIFRISQIVAIACIILSVLANIYLSRRDGNNFEK